MREFLEWVDVNNLNLTLEGKYKSFKVLYAYKNAKGTSYRAWGYASGTDANSASKEFAEFIKDENDYPEVKIIKVDEVPGEEATGKDEVTPKGLTDKTRTNQHLSKDKYSKL